MRFVKVYTVSSTAAAASSNAINHSVCRLSQSKWVAGSLNGKHFQMVDYLNVSVHLSEKVSLFHRFNLQPFCLFSLSLWAHHFHTTTASACIITVKSARAAIKQLSERRPLLQCLLLGICFLKSFHFRWQLLLSSFSYHGVPFVEHLPLYLPLLRTHSLSRRK